MPELYEKLRDECIERKKKKGKITDKQEKDCKKMAAILYYKMTGNLAQHSKEVDSLDMEILSEQLDIFGSLEEYDNWNKEE